MSAEGQTIREALNQIGPGWDMDTKYQAAMAALASLETRLAEAEEKQEDIHQSYAEQLEETTSAWKQFSEVEARLAEALQENGRLALEAATADQDWKKAEARLAEAEEILHRATAPRRKDGTYNFSREAFEQMANEYFALPSESGTPTTKGTQ